MSFDTTAHGMRLDPPMAEMTAGDVAPGGRFEQYLPGTRFSLAEHPSPVGDRVAAMIDSLAALHTKPSAEVS